MTLDDEDAQNLAAEYNLRQSSILELRGAITSGADLAVILRKTIEEDQLSIQQTKILILAACGRDASVPYTLA